MLPLRLLSGSREGNLSDSIELMAMSESVRLFAVGKLAAFAEFPERFAGSFNFFNDTIYLFTIPLKPSPAH